MNHSNLEEPVCTTPHLTNIEIPTQYFIGEMHIKDIDDGTICIA